MMTFSNPIDYKAEAVEELQSFGLTMDNLSSVQLPLPGQFGLAHKKCLIYLVRDRQCPLKDALRELHGSNDARVSALNDLYHFGLRRIHLESIKFTQYVYSIRKHKYRGGRDTYVSHIETPFAIENRELLAFLLRDCSLSIEDALRESKDLGPFQAKTLHILYHKGLRGDHLRELAVPLTKRHEGPPNPLTGEHLKALIKLIVDQGIAVADAISKLKGKKGEDIMVDEEKASNEFKM